MNVAILEVAEPSLTIANLIEKFYNPLIEQRLGTPFNVSAFVTGGGRGTIPPHINGVAVLNPVQFVELYQKKLSTKLLRCENFMGHIVKFGIICSFWV